MKKNAALSAVFVTVAFSVLISSCSKKEEEVIVPKVTYAKDVKSILATSCTPCHLAGGVRANKWDDYTATKNNITAILDRVQRAPTATGFMPRAGSPNPPLTAAQIDVLKKWQTDGLLEN
jgi:hypothetical protein